MKKKDIVKDALLTARDLEIAAKRNARNVMIEAFAPRLTDVIRQTIREEGPGPQLDDPVTDLAKGEEEETESSEVQNDAEVSDAHPEAISPDQGDKEIAGKGKKHDIDRPAPAPGQMTEEEDMDDELIDEEDDIELDDMEEGEDHDVGKLHFDDRDAGDSSFERGDGESHNVGPNEGDDYDLDEEEDIDLEEMEDMDLEEEDELDLEDDDEVDLEEEDDEEVAPEDGDPEGEDDEEIEIPDELFDDADDQELPEDGEEADADAEPEEEDDEELDLDVVDDEAGMEEQDMELGDEEFEEGLYLRREGEFQKVDPSEALQSRIDDLEEERDKLASAVTALKGQLGETNLYNLKLTHLVRLYESGLFSRKEKRRIAERLDRCNSQKQVKQVFQNIVTEAESRTVLDDVHDAITESRVRRNSKPTGESVYESDEIRRMRKIAGLD